MAKIVSKKELEDSGLSLRDYLNEQRGLTRRDNAPVVRQYADPRDLEKANSRGSRSVFSSRLNKNGTPLSAMVEDEQARAAAYAGRAMDPRSMGDRKLDDRRKKAQADLDRVKDFGKAVGYPTETETETEAKKRGGAVKKMANGGSVSSRADGIAQQGKTKGMMVKMANGGFVRAADGVAQRGKTRGKMC